MSPEPVCLLCGHGELDCVERTGTLPAVTSDDRPWPRAYPVSVCRRCGHIQKTITPAWSSDVKSIYAGYKTYRLTGGQECFVHASGAGFSRSERVIEHVEKTGTLPARGRMLDFGCGAGAALLALGARRPDWRLEGLDADASNAKRILGLPNVDAFHSGGLHELSGHYDFITMHYVLEHVPQPSDLLDALINHLHPGGTLSILVPNAAENPFDLQIVDHCSHFTLSSVGFLAAIAGRDAVVETETNIVPRSIVVLLTKKPGSASANDQIRNIAEEVRRQTEAAASWLRGVLKQATATGKNGLGIFGTGTAGTWLAGALRNRVRFFVDENRKRIGRKHLGRPVIAPESVPPNVPVYICLPPKLAADVAERLASHVPAGRFILPAPFRSSGVPAPENGRAKRRGQENSSP